ncbi:MAG: hypothetical protein ACT4QD_23755 [Acidobacteriota bacterium]
MPETRPEEMSVWMGRLDHRLEALTDLLDRVVVEIDALSSTCHGMDATLGDVRQDVQRGFADVRNSLRHMSMRMSEGERLRGR